MLRAIMGLLPLSIGVALFGIAVWVLLGKDIALGRWMLAAFLIGHALVHVMFVAPVPTPATATANGVEYPFDVARSWLVTGADLDAATVRLIAAALIAVAVVTAVLAALATVGVLVPAVWWQGLVAGTAAASMVMLVLFFSPGLILGLVIDGVLLGVVVGSAWDPATAHAAS